MMTDDKQATVAERIAELGVYTLARRADCFEPDGITSAGGEWLKLVASDAAELIADRDDDDIDDDIHERADALVPVYTHERWRVFVDLGAYNEDPSELGIHLDLTEQAGIALYLIAERLLRSLVDEFTGEDEPDD